MILEKKFDRYPNDFMYYNDGVFPYLPKDIKYLDFAVNQNDRETMTVEVTNISFEPSKDKDGNTVRISFDDQKRSAKDENGEFTMWNIVFHLGEIVEKDLKSER